MLQMPKTSLIYLLFLLFGTSLCKRKTIDFDLLEQQWAEGDAIQELETDADMTYRRQNALREDERAANGPQMIFVELVPYPPQGKYFAKHSGQMTWSKEILSEVSAVWKEVRT